jgi:hypothetical protein
MLIHPFVIFYTQVLGLKRDKVREELKILHKQNLLELNTLFFV